MHRVDLVIGMTLVLTLAGLAFGQDEQQKQTADQSPKDLELTIELTTTIMTKMFENADLTDQQRSQVTEIINTKVPQLVRTREKLQNLWSPDQKKTYQAAMKLAKQARYSTEEAEAYSLRKLKLPESELAEYHATRQKLADLQQSMNDSIAEQLTDEQKSKLKMFQDQSVKTAGFSLKLPHMKTQADATSIWNELQKIKGATGFVSDVNNKSVKFEVPVDADVKTRVAEFAAAGNQLFVDCEVVRMTEAVNKKGAAQQLQESRKKTSEADLTKPGSTKPGSTDPSKSGGGQN